MTSSIVSPNVQSLIHLFKRERNDNEDHVPDTHFFRRPDPLMLQFLELVYKILKLDPNEKFCLRHVLEDIKSLGLNILELEPHESAYTTIVTEAVEAWKKLKSKAAKDGGLVKVNPNPQGGFNQILIDWCIKTVVKHLHVLLCDLNRVKEKTDPIDTTSHFLLEGFAPIKHETPPTSNVKVVGEIPLDLNGMMIRNGPNPAHHPVARYSWLDGDCMLHGVRFNEGKTTYVSRYAGTSRYKQEKFFREAEFLQYADLRGHFGLFMASVQLLKAKLGILDMSYGWLNANTGLVFHDRMLMVLQDWDKPYVVNISENGDLITLGIHDYENRLSHSFVPHPKKDPITGDLFFIGVSNKPPYAIYNHVTKQGCKSMEVPITVSGPTYMHDFGITKNYVIFMDLPYCFDPEEMVEYDDWIYRLDTTKKSRFGILPRYATSEKGIAWFEFDKPFFIFHNGNSWEENDDSIILISCLMEPKPPEHCVRKSNKTSSSKRSKKEENDSKYSYSGRGGLIFNPYYTYSGPSLHRKKRKVGTHSKANIQGPSDGKTKDSNVQTKDEEEEPCYESVETTLPTLYKFTFNMKTMKPTMEELSRTYSDFPCINERFRGRKSRYIYTSAANDEFKLPYIVKYDLEWNRELKLDLADKYGSEVCFVPYYTSIKEDDGYLTTFVHDEYTSLSYVYVIDAQQMQILAMVQLPERVPYGFHAVFLTEEDLQSQMITSA